MQWSAIFLFMLCLNASARGFSQEVSLSLNKVHLKDAFTEITRQTGTPFLYTEQLLRGTKQVSVTVSHVTLETALNACLENQPLRWEMINRTVVITKRTVAAARPQDTVRQVSGIVRGYGSPLGGASVLVRGTHKGTFTDNNGAFKLKLSSTENVLEVTSVGYEGQEIDILFNTFLDINLMPLASKLDEAVVIGYGMTTKRMNTGSVGKVNGEEISKQPVSNPLQALQGRVTGLSITQNTGLPGGNFKILLRGQNSLRSDGNDLLYVVDGVPFTATALNAGMASANGTVNPLNSINPENIQSIEILRDADATAIYGSRGANGVMLITTKKGTSGKSVITANFSQGWGKSASRPDLLNTQQYRALRLEAFNHDGIVPDPSADIDLTEWDSMRSVNWFDQMAGGTAHQTQAGVSYSGGSDNTQFLVSANYFRESTVFPGAFQDQKKSLFVNVNHQALNNKLRISLSVNALHDNNDLFKSDLTAYALTLAPNTPELYDEKGKQLLWTSQLSTNPFSPLFQPYRYASQNLITNSTITYRLPANFELLANLGYTVTSADEYLKIPISSLNPIYLTEPDQGSAYSGASRITTWIAEPQVRWQKKGTVHQLSLLTGTTFQENDRSSMLLSGNGFPSEEALGNIQAAADVRITSNIQSRYRYSSLFGRVSYKYRDKYLLNLTGRRDASSRFGPGNRLGNFGAVGAAWIFSKEQGFQSFLPALSFGKFRSSYGLTGSDQIGDYGYIDRWSSTGLSYMGSATLRPDNLKNDGYGWETNRKFEVAMESSWFDDRLSLSVAWYRNLSSNQLIGYALPGATGFTLMQDNFAATVENKGWEIEAGATILRAGNWTWNASANISFPRNTLVSFPGIEGSSYANEYEVGKPLYIQKKFHNTGVDPQTGIYTFEDVNKDGAITFPQDITTYKALEQRFFGGFENRFRYKQLELSFLFQFIKQTGTNYILGFDAPGTYGNQLTAVLDHWKYPGDLKNIQAVTQDYGSELYDAFNTTFIRGDQSISDASFIRLKNVYLSYALPEKILGHSGIRQCQLFIKAQNVLTITRFPGLDPENQDASRLPPLKMLMAGISIQL